jgi:hypothetical protein
MNRANHRGEYNKPEICFVASVIMAEVVSTPAIPRFALAL